MDELWDLIGLLSEGFPTYFLIRLNYRSPNSSEENNCKLNEIMSSIHEENHAYKIIMGDFNYKDIDWKPWTSSLPENYSSHDFIESVRDSFLFQHVDFITSYRDNQRPRICRKTLRS